jgi:1A family penicillin-binding protein
MDRHISTVIQRAVRRYPRAFAGLVVALALAVWGSGGAAVWFARDLTSGLPTPEEIRRIGVMSQATTVFDVSDRPVFTIFKEQRIEVPLERVSPHLIDAIVAVEDQRFFDHRGVDLSRVVAAAIANLREGRRAQGGSTITQQLARQSFLTRDKTLRRKLQEVLLAAQIEHLYPKREILELYLNKVYFGDGLYGIEAASRGFFGKHASELDVAEAALLAGLVKSPSSYAPTVSLDRAKGRRTIVLMAMRDAGTIDQPEFERASSAPVRLKDTLRSEEPHGKYFLEEVRQELVRRFGWQRVYEGGLLVHSTIDLSLQTKAEDIVEASLRTIEEKRAKVKSLRGTEDGPLQGALIAMDPQTGEVRAMVGGRDFNRSRFNRAVQARRQPGSAFKPFVYASALEAGYSPASLVENLNDPILTPQGQWVPEDEHSTASSLTLRAALRSSSNRAAVRLLSDVGIDKTVEYAERTGLGTVPSVPSLALGSGEVTLESLSAAYAAFANGGLKVDPLLIRRVEDRDGGLLYEAKPDPQRVLAPATAFMMASMLSDVISYGTAYTAKRLGFTLPAGGKTGTTNDFVDAWFVGFTPRLLTGVWVGFDQPATILPNGFAADVAVPMWARFMKTATAGDPPDWFTPPKNIVAVNVCRASGKLPSDGCYFVQSVSDTGELQQRSLVYTEYFQRGTEPRDRCPIHSYMAIASQIADGTVPVPGAPTALPPMPPLRAPAAEPASVGTGGEDSKAAPAEPAPKRGFWSRLFGIGGGKKKSDQKKKPPQ